MTTSTISAKSSTNTAELIADALRADILQGRLKSSQPLRQDDIAAKFGVSKIPVREALYQLKAEGLVTFIPNRGATVSELSIQEVDEIYTMRIALETTALHRALPRLTIADLSRAEAILKAIDDEQNVARWSELNWEFHATLYAPADLPRLLDWVHTLHVNVARYLVIYLAGLDYQTASQQEHRTIVSACRQGDIETATATLQHHLQSASQQLATFLAQRQQ
ncbi:MAG: GntR family transcriptional regulator [Anaerolineales bacterium]|nr:GntR family transcriptional regulator [Anaerolineales bacterium]